MKPTSNTSKLLNSTVIEYRPEVVADAPLGLLFTCSAECLPPQRLRSLLADDAWIVHGTPGAIVPPYRPGPFAEADLIERAVVQIGVRRVVVCGHSPCSATDHLMRPDMPANGFDLQAWRPWVESVRRVFAGRANIGARDTVEHVIQAQAAHLLTHPAVAAAIAAGRLAIHVWLFDSARDELLYAAPGEKRFDRLAPLHPDHNAGLRREVVHRPRQRNLPWVPDSRRYELA